MSGTPTEEESKDQDVVQITLKPYDEEHSKATTFFTDLTAEQILQDLMEYLQESETQFEISNNASKISYKKTRDGASEEVSDDNLII